MFKSMTSFSRHKEIVGNKEITVEIKAVNSRYFECQTRITRNYSYIEYKIKPYLVSRGICRGKVDVCINVEHTDDAECQITLNRAYAGQYVSVLRQLATEFDLSDEVSVADVAKNPEVFNVSKPELDEEQETEDIFSVLCIATDKFIEGRALEGQRIEADIREKAEKIRNGVNKIKELSQGNTEQCRQRIEQRIRAILSDADITVDENRLLTECAIYADKIAIDEELVRLESHLCAFDEFLDSSDAVGRSMDFLLQEINREINTIGSKCSDAEIAHVVVYLKNETEKIREQIQNIE